MIIDFNGNGGGGGGSYTLPKATATQLGGIKVGSNLSIDADGVLSAQGGSGATVEPIIIPIAEGDEGYYTTASTDTIKIAILSKNLMFKLNDDNDLLPAVEYYWEEDGTYEAYALSSWCKIYISVNGEDVTVSFEEIEIGGAKPIVHLDTLETEGDYSDNTIYEVDGNLYKYDTASEHPILEWIASEPLVFSKIVKILYVPSNSEGFVLCNYGSYSNKRAIKVYSDRIDIYNQDGTFFNTLAKGSSLEFTDGRYTTMSTTLSYKDNYIIFVPNGGSLECANKATTLGTTHFIPLNDSYAVASNIKEDYGVPRWNKQGIVTGKIFSATKKSFYINNDAYGNYLNLLVDGSSFDGRIYAPTAAGTSGQILKSSGSNNAPVYADFSSFIGGLKIAFMTQDEYDNLAEKDNETLYVIKND